VNPLGLRSVPLLARIIVMSAYPQLDTTNYANNVDKYINVIIITVRYDVKNCKSHTGYCTLVLQNTTRHLEGRVADPNVTNFGRWIRIRLRVKSWILDLHIVPGKNSGLLRLKMQAWRATDAHNGGVEVQNGALEGL
jgi:hypothetical protein